MECTADAAVHGGKLSSSGEIDAFEEPGDFVLLAFRTSAVEGWAVSKAVIALHLAGRGTVPGSVAVAPITAAWNESARSAPAVGASVAVSARPLQDGWFSVELPPKVSEALAKGTALGVSLMAKDGEEFAIHSRRTGQFTPYLLVRGTRPVAAK